MKDLVELAFCRPHDEFECVGAVVEWEDDGGGDAFVSFGVAELHGLVKDFALATQHIDIANALCGLDGCLKRELFCFGLGGFCQSLERDARCL